MHLFLKKPAIAIVAAMLLIHVSRLKVDETPARTAQTETTELNSLLANLTTKGYNIDTTLSGIFYIIHKKGTGFYPLTGDTCFMKYTGYFISGNIFDSSVNHFTDGIWKFNYKENQLIPGFEDGIALMNKGTEIDMIIPSKLAYGTDGYGTIPPYTPLIFGAKMEDLKPKK